MASVNDIGPEKANQLLASELKKIDKITPPSWASFVKTGNHKERPPENPDWWFVRAASILKNIYNHGPVGVSKMRTRYGGKKDRGRKPERFAKASGNIIRKIVQQLESAELIKNSTTQHKGRMIAPRGQSLLDKISLTKSKPAKKEIKK
jgi:small subunit ribosomal protein S19e